MAINIFQISQDKKKFGKRIINQICGFFCHFLALFDTFSARYSYAGIKFEFSEQFQSIKHFI
jgi:hypothetical protein